LVLPNLDKTLDGLARLGPIQDPQLLALEQLWKSKRNHQAYPARSDFEPRELGPWLGHVGLVDVMESPLRFKIRLMGEGLVHVAGGDYTGRWLDECASRDRIATVLRPFLRCLESGKPVHDNIGYSVRGSGRITLLRLYLPCAADRETIDLIVVGAYARQEFASVAGSMPDMSPDIL
jgi:hypothetical protein